MILHDGDVVYDEFGGAGNQHEYIVGVITNLKLIQLYNINQCSNRCKHLDFFFLDRYIH